ncbi:hypothetical protein PSHT_10513 [Puccinia striiformis]|uniref:Uncharacterized protein n=2 Tax=Puccinia striiformis TaxID=27350 RepID=A0A0L0UTX4_9BASI|nr:hypothetical protein KEM48_011946 [Puccinia striiformis f. sp. tritici PST-130]KNE90391.1 hypothetical protein PSTG_16170 [Puccinia striiformis f. sp. tritici PST-78]POW06092.1 hypothetical protein PSHT_10513 [Puccinia striiformis]
MSYSDRQYYSNKLGAVFKSTAYALSTYQLGPICSQVGGMLRHQLASHTMTCLRAGVWRYTIIDLNVI